MIFAKELIPIFEADKEYDAEELRENCLENHLQLSQIQLES